MTGPVERRERASFRRLRGEAEERALREAMIEAGARALRHTLRPDITPYTAPEAIQKIYRLRAGAALEASGALDLAAAVLALLRRHDDEDPGAAFSPDGGCIECTDGVTPDDRNTGACPRHRIERVLKRLKP